MTYWVSTVDTEHTSSPVLGAVSQGGFYYKWRNWESGSVTFHWVELGLRNPIRPESFARSFLPGNGQSWDVARSWVVCKAEVPWQDSLWKGRAHSIVTDFWISCQTPLGVTVWCTLPLQHNQPGVVRESVAIASAQKQESHYFLVRGGNQVWV